MKVDCSVIQDTLRGDDANAIRVRFVEYLEDSTQYMLSEGWDCLFHIFDFFGMDSIAKKEGAEPKAEGGNTIVIQVCDSVCSFFSKFHSSRKAELFTFV